MGKFISANMYDNNGVDPAIIDALNAAVGEVVFTIKDTGDTIIQWFKENYVVKTDTTTERDLWDPTYRYTERDDDDRSTTVYGRLTSVVTELCGNIGYWHSERDDDGGRGRSTFRSVPSGVNPNFGVAVWSRRYDHSILSETIMSEYPIDFSRYSTLRGSCVTERDSGWSAFSFSIRTLGGYSISLPYTISKNYSHHGWWTIDLRNIDACGHLYIRKTNIYADEWIGNNIKIAKNEGDVWETSP